jgi:hypothetical protein
MVNNIIKTDFFNTLNFSEIKKSINSKISLGSCFVDCIKRPFSNGVQSIKQGVQTISTECVKIVKRTAKIGSIIFDEMKAMGDRANANKNLSTTYLELAKAQGLEAYYQVIAHKLGYEPLKEGQRIVRSTQFACPQYKVEKIIDDEYGLRAIFLAPEVSDGMPEAPPLVIFRGTDETNVLNVLDDASSDIGNLNFSRKKDVLQREIEAFALKYGNVHVMGQSFGGVMAQRVTAEFPEYVGRCSYYNAPGVGEKFVHMFKDKMRTLPPGFPPPKIYSFRHAKDIPSLLGGDHLPPSIGCEITFGDTSDSITHVKAHSHLSYLERTKARGNYTVPYDYRCVTSGIDSLRKVVSSLIPIVAKSFEVFK